MKTKKKKNVNISTEGLGRGLTMRHGDTGSVSRGRRSLTPQTRLVASPIPMPPAFGAHSEVLPAPSLPREDVQWAREVGAVPLPASPSVRVALPATFPQVASPQYTASAVVGDVHGASRYAADVKSPLHVREAAPAVVPLARPLLASSPSAGGCDYTYSVQHDVQRDVRDAYLYVGIVFFAQLFCTVCQVVLCVK